MEADGQALLRRLVFAADAEAAAPGGGVGAALQVRSERACVLGGREDTPPARSGSGGSREEQAGGGGNSAACLRQHASDLLPLNPPPRPPSRAPPRPRPQLKAALQSQHQPGSATPAAQSLHEVADVHAQLSHAHRRCGRVHRCANSGGVWGGRHRCCCHGPPTLRVQRPTQVPCPHPPLHTAERTPGTLERHTSWRSWASPSPASPPLPPPPPPSWLYVQGQAVGGGHAYGQPGPGLCHTGPGRCAYYALHALVHHVSRHGSPAVP